MRISAYKNSIVRDLFVRTADENYITARWCAANGLNIDFFWLAVHALEKYLKAVLLMNGKSAKGFSHDIVRLYAAVKPIGLSLLPATLSRPKNLDIQDWLENTPDEFIKRLQRNGNEHNRYLIHGYDRNSEDIHMLDAMVFAMRRLICPLEGMVFSGEDAPNFTHRNLLERKPEYFDKMNMPLDNLIEASEDSEIKTALLNLNVAFAPDGFPHTPIRSGYSMRNSVIGYRIFETLESDHQEKAKEGIEIAQWFIQNIQTHKDVKTEIENAINDACGKHGIRS